MESLEPESEPDALRRRLRAGDHDAFGDLYEAHVKAVHRHALRLTGNWSTAEEVVSGTFFAARRQRARLAAGPPGIGITFADGRSATRSEWISDRNALAFLGDRCYFTGRGRKPDVLFHTSAVLRRTVVDRLGETG